MEVFDSTETEANDKALKHVAGLLQRPDQLDKVDQYRRRTARKKASVEARLKAAVQSQLDGVKAGLLQLTEALQEVKDVKTNMTDVDEMYSSCGTLSDSMRDIKDVSSEHRQLAAAMENLKHIFAVPEEVEKAEQLIKDGRLLEAHKSLTDLESSRDDLLYEQYKLENRSESDIKQLQMFFMDAEKLSTDLGNALWSLLVRSLTVVRKDSSQLVTVLRIVEREHRADMNMLEQKNISGFLPPGRPKRWRERAMETLKKAVDDRIASDAYENRDMDKMWLVRHLEILRQYVLEDLRVVKGLCSPCFPPAYNIFTQYVHWYHLALSEHLQLLIQEGLEGNEIISFLTWLNGYTGPELMGHADLAPDLDTNRLPQLLDDNVSEELIRRYFDTTQNNISAWTKKSLEREAKDWRLENEPETDSEGYYRTSLPVILFQMLKQTMQVAETISSQLKQKVFEVCLTELNRFVRLYAEEIVSYKEEHFCERGLPPYYPLYMVAAANNCEAFIEFATQMQDDYLHQIGQKTTSSDVHELLKMDGGNPFDEETENNSPEAKMFKEFQARMQQVAQTTCSFLLDEVFLDLKPHCENLFTRTWFTVDNIVDTICVTIEDYYSDFVHLRRPYFDWIMREAERRVTVEYLKAALGRRIKFSNAQERVEAGEKLTREQDILSAFFNRLSSSRYRSPCEALIPIAEVIKLQDKTMMPLELSGLVNKFPDVTMEQLKALLAIRGDFSANDAKELTAELANEMQEIDDDSTERLFADVSNPQQSGFFKP